MIPLNSLYTKNKVHFLTEIQSNFSDLYIAVRTKEQRILSAKQIQSLPYLDTFSPHVSEWELRQKSTTRFTEYLNRKKTPLNILDIGCGNGWFSNLLATISPQHQIIGLDVNVDELYQATEIFSQQNLIFAYGDIFKINTFKKQFDCITLNGCIQYFSDLDLLITTLKSFLKPHGEIHIIDSPFYNKGQIVSAKRRTLDYYTQLGFPEMASHYFHHSFENIKDFKILYKPTKSIINKLLSKKDSPFMWLCYTRDN